MNHVCDMKIKKQVSKYIMKQPRNQRDGLIDVLMAYPQVDTERMRCRDGKVRARYGKYRVIFQPESDGSTTAILAGVRGDVYKHLRSRMRRLELMRRRELEKWQDD